MSDTEEQKLLDAHVLETEVTSPEAAIIEKTARQGRLFAALKHQEYRYLWTGALLSNIGTWIQSIALGWFVLELTNSEFSLGLVNFASGIPTFFLALFAGMAADRYDRRSLLILTQGILMGLALVLATFVSFDSATFMIVIVITFAAGIATSFGFPAWLSLIPELVPKKDLLNAVALNSAQFNVARLLGPAIAGLIIKFAGVAVALYVNAVSFLAVIVALLLVKSRSAGVAKADGSERAWQRFIGGVRYARSHVSTATLLILIGVLTLFGLSHTVLLPVFARDILGRGPQVYGNLMAASGLGAVTGALLVASASNIASRKTLIKAGMAFYGASLLLFASSETYIVSLVAQFFAGSAFLTCVSTINTSLQSSTPPEIRGRVMSLFVWALMGIFPFGGFLAGSLAQLLGAPIAVGFGAIMLISSALALQLRPRLLASIE